MRNPNFLQNLDGFRVTSFAGLVPALNACHRSDISLMIASAICDLQEFPVQSINTRKRLKSFLFIIRNIQFLHYACCHINCTLTDIGDPVSHPFKIMNCPGEVIHLIKRDGFRDHPCHQFTSEFVVKIINKVILLGDLHCIF